MKYPILVPAAVLFVLPVTAGFAQDKANNEFIQEAEAGGPPRIASAAAIARLEPGGKVVPVREGSNGFTCTIMPDGSNAPFCGDEGGFAWLVAAMSKQPEAAHDLAGHRLHGEGGRAFRDGKGRDRDGAECGHEGRPGAAALDAALAARSRRDRDPNAARTPAAATSCSRERRTRISWSTRTPRC